MDYVSLVVAAIVFVVLYYVWKRIEKSPKPKTAENYIPVEPAKLIEEDKNVLVLPNTTRFKAQKESNATLTLKRLSSETQSSADGNIVGLSVEDEPVIKPKKKVVAKKIVVEKAVPQKPKTKRKVTDVNSSVSNTTSTSSDDFIIPMVIASAAYESAPSSSPTSDDNFIAGGGSFGGGGASGSWDSGSSSSYSDSNSSSSSDSYSSSDSSSSSSDSSSW